MNDSKRNATPPWPTDKNWPDIVHTHNKAVNDRHITVVETLSGAKSITLVIVCAAVEKPIPLCYLLNNKRKNFMKELSCPDLRWQLLPKLTKKPITLNPEDEIKF